MHCCVFAPGSVLTDNCRCVCSPVMMGGGSQMVFVWFSLGLFTFAEQNINAQSCLNKLKFD